MTLKNFSYTKKCTTITQDTKKVCLCYVTTKQPPQKKTSEKNIKISYTSKNPCKTPVTREQNEKSSHNWGGGGGYSS